MDYIGGQIPPETPLGLPGANELMIEQLGVVDEESRHFLPEVLSSAQVVVFLVRGQGGIVGGIARLTVVSLELNVYRLEVEGLRMLMGGLAGMGEIFGEGFHSGWKLYYSKIFALLTHTTI
jgi:hypothetical protein